MTTSLWIIALGAIAQGVLLVLFGLGYMTIWYALIPIWGLFAILFFCLFKSLF